MKRANNGVVQLPTDGSGTIEVRYVAPPSATTDVVIDAVGYFQEPVGDH